jgi:hypothetical protein
MNLATGLRSFGLCSIVTDRLAIIAPKLFLSVWLNPLAGQYENPMPESTISPQSGAMNLATGLRSFGLCSILTGRLAISHWAMLLLYDWIHKVLTYVECRAVSGVIQNIDPPPPPPPPSECVLPPHQRLGEGGTHSPGGEGVGGQYFGGIISLQLDLCTIGSCNIYTVIRGWFFYCCFLYTIGIYKFGSIVILLPHF